MSIQKPVFMSHPDEPVVVILGAAALAMAAALVLAPGPSLAQRRPPGPAKVNGVLMTAAQATPERLRTIHAEGANTVVLSLTDGEAAADGAAARRIQAAGLPLYYWIEIGRNPALAQAHPEWMASLQGHPEWRRHFPNAPSPGAGEVVKNYPWVPVMYQEAFDAHLKRVAALLEERPAPKGVFLNDLQGAPSACGCGNLLCRWTSDYGPIRTATRLPADAAANFAAAVQTLAPQAKIIPVWTTECEEHDGAKDGPCAGVGCFAGACWKEYTAQLMPLAEQCETLAALVPYRAFQRDLPRYGPTAGWVTHALSSFVEMPPRRQGRPISMNRVVAVLQGWDVTAAQVQAQIQRSREAGAAGHVVARMKIDQSWEPRIVKTP